MEQSNTEGDLDWGDYPEYDGADEIDDEGEEEPASEGGWGVEWE